MESKFIPDEPTPIDQIRPEILVMWDQWIRKRKDKSERYTTTAPEGVTPRVRDRPLALQMHPNASRSETLLYQKRDDY